MAPDPGIAKSGRGLASQSKWLALGKSDRAVWGEIKGSGKNPYQVRIDLTEPAFKCSCPSRKFPCKHGIGLFLIFAEHEKGISSQDPPDWVRDWLEQRDARKGQRAARAAEPREVDAQAQARRAEKREEKVRGGVEELSLWLADLVRQGIGSAQIQPHRFWDQVAARMVDAQAPGLARYVRQLGDIASSGEGWQSRMLRCLGQLYLLLEAYSRIESLPSDLQADVRASIGWTVPKEELLKLDPVEDTWMVMGQRTTREEQLRVQKTWLWGLDTRHRALILQFAAGAQGFESSFAVDAQFQGKLVFYPSAGPLRALVVERHDDVVAARRPEGAASVDAAMLDYVQAIAAQPWLEGWPMLLDAVTPAPVDHGDGTPRWRLVDSSGYSVPIEVSNLSGWQLLSISGGQPISVFGEWDGVALRPMSAALGQSFFCSVQFDGGSILTRVA